MLILAATVSVAVFKLCEVHKERKLAQLREGIAKVGIEDGIAAEDEGPIDTAGPLKKRLDR